MGIPSDSGGWWTPILGFIGSLVAAVMAGVWAAAWKIAGQETKRLEDERKFRTDVDAAIDASSRAVGESLSALRQKATDMELWNRDNFVRRQEFASMVESFNRSVESLGSKFDVAVSRLESKIDRLQSRSWPQGPAE